MDIKIHVDIENQLLKFFTANRPFDGSKLQEWEIGECKIADFNEEIDNRSKSIRTEILPNAVRYFGANQFGGSFTIIFEQKPQYRVFQWSSMKLDDFGSDVDGEAENTFYIPTPFVQYLVQVSASHQVSEIQVYFSNTSFELDKFTQCSYPAVIHNIYDNGGLCRPIHNVEYDMSQSASLMSILDQVEAEVWSSGANMDLYSTVSMYYNHYVQQNSEEACGCEEEDCEEYHSDRSDWPTLFDYIDLNGGSSWNDLINNGWSAFSHTFYKGWQSVPMENILQCCWGNPDNGIFVSRSIPPNARCGDKSMKNSELLACAQNAIMRSSVVGL